MDEHKRKIMYKIEDLNETRAMIRKDLRDLEERKHKMTEKKYEHLKEKYDEKLEKIKEKIHELEGSLK